jgi:ubiquinone/menaquinone biosynthesis C-methylase UbiE
MLDAARRRLAGHPAAHFVNADYAVPAWTRAVAEFAPFDAVVSGFSIHHQPDERKREVYSEIYGLLQPGGIFLNVEHVSSATPWVESVHDDLFVDHLMRLHTDRPRGEVAANYYHRPDKAANILAPAELQCQWLRDIGFTDVDCYLKVFELAVFGGRRLS